MQVLQQGVTEQIFVIPGLTYNRRDCAGPLPGVRQRRSPMTSSYPAPFSREGRTTIGCKNANLTYRMHEGSSISCSSKSVRGCCGWGEYHEHSAQQTGRREPGPDCPCFGSRLRGGDIFTKKRSPGRRVRVVLRSAAPMSTRISSSMFHVKHSGRRELRLSHSTLVNFNQAFLKVRREVQQAYSTDSL